MGKAVTSLHTSVYSLPSWLQLKLHLEAECSPCASQKATAQWLDSGTTYLAAVFSVFPAAKFSPRDAEQLCADLLTKPFKYTNFCFFLYPFIRLISMLSLPWVSSHESVCECCCFVPCPWSTWREDNGLKLAV